MAPKSVARGGPAKRGSGSVGDADRTKYTWGANSPLRGRTFLRKTLLPALPGRTIRRFVQYFLTIPVKSRNSNREHPAALAVLTQPVLFGASRHAQDKNSPGFF
jgi:hypothetical protein